MDFERVLSHDFRKLECLGLGEKSPHLFTEHNFPSLQVLGVDASLAKQHRGISSAKMLHVKLWASTKELYLPQSLGIRKVLLDLSPRFMCNFDRFETIWKMQIQDFIEQVNISVLILLTEMREFESFYADFKCDVRFIENALLEF